MKIRRPIFLGFIATLSLLALALPACQSGGHFSILGYTTRPNYDPGIKTVRVPIFKNETFRQRIEFDLTEAVIREIQEKTPYRVVPASYPADAELLGKIVGRSKQLVIPNQLGEVRDAETTLTVELVYRDLRPGKFGTVITNPLDPSQPPITTPAPPAPKVIVQSLGSFRPELGESLTSAEKTMVDRMAVQIVSMMEQPF